MRYPSIMALALRSSILALALTSVGTDAHQELWQGQSSGCHTDRGGHGACVNFEEYKLGASSDGGGCVAERGCVLVQPASPLPGEMRYDDILPE